MLNISLVGERESYFKPCFGSIAARWASRTGIAALRRCKLYRNTRGTRRGCHEMEGPDLAPGQASSTGRSQGLRARSTGRGLRLEQMKSKNDLSIQFRVVKSTCSEDVPVSEQNVRRECCKNCVSVKLLVPKNHRQSGCGGGVARSNR